MSNKTLRGNVDILIAKDFAFADPHNPLVAELNDTDKVFNISCAVNDDYTFGLTSPDTDSTQSICDVTSVETPTFANYEVALNIFRDEDNAANGVYNTALALLKGAGVNYWVIQRIGRAQGSAFASSDIISMLYVRTDYPADVLDAGSPMQLAANFKAQGDYLAEFEVA